VDSENAIYVALRGGDQNIKKFAWDGAYLGDFTESQGGYGPGQIGFDANSDLISAGFDATGHPLNYRYDGVSGEILDTFIHPSVSYGSPGMHVSGYTVFSATLATDTVIKYDLQQSPVAGAILIQAPDILDRPLGMTIGHNGSLFVANVDGPRIEEFDAVTGVSLGTFVDMSVYGATRTYDIVFVAGVDRYLVSTGQDAVFEFSTIGELDRVFTSDLLDEAYSMTVASVPSVSVEETHSVFGGAIRLVSNPCHRQAQFINSIAGPKSLVEVFDVRGRLVDRFGMAEEANWTPPAGSPRRVYFARVAVGSATEVIKFTVLR
jgi:hypothetical protein